MRGLKLNIYRPALFRLSRKAAPAIYRNRGVYGLWLIACRVKAQRRQFADRLGADRAIVLADFNLVLPLVANATAY